MKITVKRRIFTDDSTISDLYVNDLLFCYALEDKFREVEDKPVSEWKVKGKTAIPSGIYDVIIDHSTRFERMMLHILNVPGFEGVRFHSGNTHLDTEGCILVGTIKLQNEIRDSRTAEKKLFAAVNAAINRGEKIICEVING